MEEKIPVSDEIFPKDTNKSYTLVELMQGERPLVGKGPENTLFSFLRILVLMYEAMSPFESAA